MDSERKKTIALNLMMKTLSLKATPAYTDIYRQSRKSAYPLKPAVSNTAKYATENKRAIRAVSNETLRNKRVGDSYVRKLLPPFATKLPGVPNRKIKRPNGSFESLDRF